MGFRRIGKGIAPARAQGRVPPEPPHAQGQTTSPVVLAEQPPARPHLPRWRHARGCAPAPCRIPRECHTQFHGRGRPSAPRTLARSRSAVRGVVTIQKSSKRSSDPTMRERSTLALRAASHRRILAAQQQHSFEQMRPGRSESQKQERRMVQRRSPCTRGKHNQCHKASGGATF